MDSVIVLESDNEQTKLFHRSTTMQLRSRVLETDLQDVEYYDAHDPDDNFSCICFRYIFTNFIPCQRNLEQSVMSFHLYKEKGSLNLTNKKQRSSTYFILFSVKPMIFGLSEQVMDKMIQPKVIIDYSSTWIPNRNLS